MFTEAMAPLTEKRRADGYDVVISTQPVDKAIAALPRQPAAMLLVGDDMDGQKTPPWRIPAKSRPLYRWRAQQRKTFASDVAWADLDGDGVPEFPTGRLPCRTAEQVGALAAKIVAYENRPPSPEDLALPVWAGAPGYGDPIDSVATSMLIQIARVNAPAWARPWLMSGDANSPLCAWPQDQPALFNRRLRQGGLLTCLIGHGGADTFYSMPLGKGWVVYDAAAAKAGLGAGPPAGPMVMFACESGNFTQAQPCLTRSLLLLPGGPVATIAATTESHPLTNLYSGVCLLRQLGGRETRLGPMWLTAQKAAMKMRDVLAEQMLLEVEGTLEEPINLQKLRRDQMLMYALLGDPATELRVPRPLQAQVRRDEAGWHWSVQKPAEARTLVAGFRPAAVGGPEGMTPEAPQPAEMTPNDKPQALATFEAANAAFDFPALPAPAANQAWEGTISRPGLLRLVAIGRRDLYVAVLVLKSPATQPAWGGRPDGQATTDPPKR
jgi:hypothetical protein